MGLVQEHRCVDAMVAAIRQMEPKGPEAQGKLRSRCDPAGSVEVIDEAGTRHLLVGENGARKLGLLDG